ncbi:MAG: Ig domain-containing protein [Candidatus Acidiferrales bacterium]
MTTLKAYAQISKAAARQRGDTSENSDFSMQPAGVLPSRLRLLALVLLSLLGVSFLVGCGGGSGITLEIIPNTSQTVDQGQIIQFSAILGNDTGNRGVTWKPLTGTGCAGTGCGTLTNVTKTSVTYTAPTNSSVALTVSLEAIANADSGVNVTTSINVVLPPTFTTTTLPNGSNGVNYSQQIVVTGGVTPLVFSVVCNTNQNNCLPPGLTLNQTGNLVGVPTTAGTYNFYIKATDRGGIQVPNQLPPLSVTSTLFTVTINPPTALSVTTTTLPPGYIGQPYSATLSAKGGVTPYTWTIPANSLPPGLALNMSTGVISGTPTTVGSYPFVATVQDSAVPPQTATSGTLVISVQTPQPLQATTASLPNGMTATPYSGTLTATGGVQPYTWSVVTGQLPAGLILNAQAGTITGTPILTGTSVFTVQVQDNSKGAGGPAKATQQLQITVITGTTSSNMLIDGSYSFLFNGFDDNGTVLIAGNFLTDGNGKVLSGEEVINRVNPGGTTYGVVSATLTGTYALDTDGRGTMQLVATNEKTAIFTANYLIAIDSATNLHVIENDTTGNAGVGITHGSGIMKPVVGTFSAANFSGNYAFEFNGRDYSAAPEVLAGVVVADNGETLTGMGDLNDASVYGAQISLVGNFQVFSANSEGEAQLTFQPPAEATVTLTFDFFFASSSDIFFIETDAATTSNTLPRLSGEMVLQNTSTQFNNTVLQGSGVVTGTGLAGSNSTVFAGLLASTLGDGNATLSYTQNDAGTVTTNSSSGSYQVQSNGRVEFTGLGSRLAAAYLTGPNQGFIIGSDTAVTYGLLEQQTGAPYSPSSIQGSYALFAPKEADTSVVNMLGQLAATGAGTISGTLDEFIPPSTPSTGQALSGTYTVTSDGSGTMTPNQINGFPANLALYVVSPSSVRMIPMDPASGDPQPQVIFLNH